jgi:hypothetical protein
MEFEVIGAGAPEGRLACEEPRAGKELERAE